MTSNSAIDCLGAEGEDRTHDTGRAGGAGSEFMRASTVFALGAITAVAEHLQAGRKALPLEPAEEGVTTRPAAWHPRAGATDVIQRQKLQLGFTATGTAHRADAVVGECLV